MVFINGVKYACERCIRGHRVTTCTHTDQPLTMIKPKGRPATQCQHCREQRKNKNLHILCTCGKKGKAPSMHSESCACHKTSQCTCNQINSRRLEMKKKTLKKSASEVSIPIYEGKISRTSTPPNNLSSASGSLVFEDMMLPIHDNNGLFEIFDGSKVNVEQNKRVDSFSPSKSSSASFNGSTNVIAPRAQVVSNGKGNFTSASEHPTMVSSDSHQNAAFSVSETSHFDIQEKGESLIAEDYFRSSRENVNDDFSSVENMFPLFPLVGTLSLDRKDQPLSVIPDELKSKIEGAHVYSSLDYKNSGDSNSVQESTGSISNVDITGQDRKNDLFNYNSSANLNGLDLNHQAINLDEDQSVDGGLKSPHYESLSYSIEDFSSNTGKDDLLEHSGDDEINFDSYQQFMDNFSSSAQDLCKLSFPNDNLSLHSISINAQAQIMNEPGRPTFKQDPGLNGFNKASQEVDLDANIYGDLMS